MSEACEFCQKPNSVTLLGKHVVRGEVRRTVHACTRCMILLDAVEREPELVRQILSIDLKDVIATIGNRLVQEHGFTPAAVCTAADLDEPNTLVLAKVTEFFNDNPQARWLLSDMGFQWKV